MIATCVSCRERSELAAVLVQAHEGHGVSAVDLGKKVLECFSSCCVFCSKHGGIGLEVIVMWARVFC